MCTHTQVVPFVEAAYALERDKIRVQTDHVQKAFHAQRVFMTYVARCRRPPDSDVTALLADTSEVGTYVCGNVHACLVCLFVHDVVKRTRHYACIHTDTQPRINAQRMRMKIVASCA